MTYPYRQFHQLNMGECFRFADDPSGKIYERIDYTIIYERTRLTRGISVRTNTDMERVVKILICGRDF